MEIDLFLIYCMGFKKWHIMLRIEGDPSKSNSEKSMLELNLQNVRMLQYFINKNMFLDLKVEHVSPIQISCAL